MGKIVNDILKEICTDLGFVRKKDLYIKPVSDNIYLTIFFSIASYRVKGYRFVAPRIGMIYEDVEKTLRDVSKSEWPKGITTNTISEHIGYIMPIHEWKEWEFVEYGTNSKIINDFKGKLRKYNLKRTLKKYSDIYCAQFSDIENAIKMIESKPWGSAYSILFRRLPIMYYLTGKKQKGIDFINRAFAEGYSEANIIFTDVYISNFEKLP